MGPRLFGQQIARDCAGTGRLTGRSDATKPLSLLDMVGLENRLADLLGVTVDLSPAKMLKEPVREKGAREAVLAF